MTNTTLIDNFEGLLSIQFTPEHVRRIRFKVEEFGFFADLLQTAFQDLKLPPKSSDDEIRPGYYRPRTPWMVGAPVRIDPFPAENVKQVLLYSDAVAIDMTPILGRLRMASSTMVSMMPRPWQQLQDKSLIGEIEQCLCKIAEFADLIKQSRSILFLPRTKI